MKKRSFALGAFLGVIAGAVTTALTTPKRGDELRTDIRKEAEKFYDISTEKYNQLSEESKTKFNSEMEKIKLKYSETSTKYYQELEKLKNKYFTKIINNEEDKKDDYKTENESSTDLENK